MLAAKGRLGTGSLPRVPKVREVLRIMPVAAIYGGNAGGKSNMVRALQALKKIVTKGVIPVFPFRLDDVSPTAPTVFSICVVASGETWEYEISVRDQKVETEKLSIIVQGKPKDVFVRKSEQFSMGILPGASKNDMAAMQSIGNAIQPDVPFVFFASKLKTVSNGISPFCNWFAKTLCIIPAGARRKALSMDLFTNRISYGTALAQADTGVSGLECKEIKEIDLESLHISQEDREKMLAAADDQAFILGEDTVVMKKNGNFYKYQALFQHMKTNGEAEQFRLSEESDGTQRLMHLLPVVLDRRKHAPEVFVVDELDRSLHTELSRALVERHLESALDPNTGTCRQLIFTTHDVMLIDPQLMSVDSMWAVERMEDGASRLFSFVEFKEAAKDRHLRRSYMEGRMGGVPSLSLL